MGGKVGLVPVRVREELRVYLPLRVLLLEEGTNYVHVASISIGPLFLGSFPATVTGHIFRYQSRQER